MEGLQNISGEPAHAPQTLMWRHEVTRHARLVDTVRGSLAIRWYVGERQCPKIVPVRPALLCFRDDRKQKRIYHKRPYYGVACITNSNLRLWRVQHYAKGTLL